MARHAPEARDRSLELRGIATARGVAIGPVFKMSTPTDLEHLDYTPRDDAEQEERDLIEALGDARRELDDTREDMGEQFGPDFAAVFHTHIQILEDKGFVSKLHEGVRRSGNALEALRDVIGAYRKTFARIEDPYFRERVWDVEDVGRRVMERLLGVRYQKPAMSKGAIVVVDSILPGHFARLEMDKVSALVPL